MKIACTFLFFLLFGFGVFDLSGNNVPKKKQQKERLSFNTGFDYGYTINSKKTSDYLKDYLQFGGHANLEYNRFYIQVMGTTSAVIFCDSTSYKTGYFKENERTKLNNSSFTIGYILESKAIRYIPNIGYNYKKFDSNKEGIKLNRIHGISIGIDIEKELIGKRGFRWVINFKNKLDFNNYNNTFDNFGKVSYMIGIGFGIGF